MENWSFETKSIHSGTKVDAETGATRTPIYQSAGFAHQTAESLEDTFKGRKFGYFYSRVSNPTITALEARLTALEGGVGSVVVASGMAAVSTTVFALTRAGDNFVSSKSLFGSTYQLFKGLVQNNGIEPRFVDGMNLAAIDDKTQFVYFESIGNPKLDVADFMALSKITTAKKIPLIVDSTFT